MQFIMCANSGENPIDQPNASRFQPGQNCQSGPSTRSARPGVNSDFPGHVWAGDELDPFRRSKWQSLATKRSISLGSFDDWMPACDDIQFVVIGQRGPNIVIQYGYFGQAASDVEPGNCRCCWQQPVSCFPDSLAYLGEDTPFDFDNTLLGIQDKRFIFL